MASFRTMDYATILQGLEEFGEYLTNLGLRWATGRLNGVIANIKEVEKARAEKRLASLNAHPDFDQLVWSFIEGKEWTDIYRGLRNYDPKVTKPLFWKALKGPLHPLKETLSSNRARNTTFELLLAAKFRGTGAYVKLGQQADLLIEHAGAHLYIECKRPFRDSSIAENVTKARTQLRERFDSDPQLSSVGGLVAIDISKAINPGSKWFVVDQQQALEQLTTDVNRIHENYASDYTSQIDIRLAGMVYYLCTPALVRTSEHPLFTTNHTEFFLWDGFNAVFPFSGNALKQLFGQF